MHSCFILDQGMEMTYLFYRSLHNVTYNVAFPFLPQTDNAANGLTLYRRVPLRFEKVNAISNGQDVQPHRSSS